MNRQELEDYLLTKPAAKLDYPFDSTAAVYKVHDKMFAIVADNSNPIRISLKCDPLLAETLRDKYESVLPGYHLNKKHWNTIIMSGQLSDEEVKDLIVHSYELVKSALPKEVQDELEAS